MATWQEFSTINDGALRAPDNVRFSGRQRHNVAFGAAPFPHSDGALTVKVATNSCEDGPTFRVNISDQPTIPRGLSGELKSQAACNFVDGKL
jgi:hypothetical protein